jgi:hypothetical protein
MEARERAEISLAGLFFVNQMPPPKLSFYEIATVGLWCFSRHEFVILQ